MKQCSRCKVLKNIDEFYKDKNKLDGRKYNCKQCANEMTSNWRKNNPDKYKQICTTERTEELAHKSKMRSRNHRTNLTDTYIRDLMTMNTDLNPQDIPIEMVKIWKINLKLKRELGLTRKLKEEED